MTAWTIGIGAAVILVAVAGFLVIRSKIGARPLPVALRTGRELPFFRARDENGNSLSSDQLRGAPAVILFVRGNWCPFCSRQVADLTRYYKRINELGARLVLVTPQPLETTRRVAEFFDFEFEFWLDEELAAASALGLVQNKGVPHGYRAEYGENTLWPASLVVDANGIIRYASISKMIADRPNPERFVRTLDAIKA